VKVFYVFLYSMAIRSLLCSYLKSLIQERFKKKQASFKVSEKYFKDSRYFNLIKSV